MVWTLCLGLMCVTWCSLCVHALRVPPPSDLSFDPASPSFKAWYARHAAATSAEYVEEALSVLRHTQCLTATHVSKIIDEALLKYRCVCVCFCVCLCLCAYV